MAVASSNPLAILRRKAVETRTGLGRTTIYEGMASGTFPKAIRLTGRTVGWLESDIDAWINQRVIESRKVAP